MFNALEADMWMRIIELDKENEQLKTEIKQMKKEILELRDAFDTMKILAIPKAFTDDDYLSTTVLKICEEVYISVRIFNFLEDKFIKKFKPLFPFIDYYIQTR